MGAQTAVAKMKCFWDMDAAAPTHRPDEHTTADVIKFCSASCMFDFQCMPMCPDCGRDSKDDHVKKPGEGWLNPYMMRNVWGTYSSNYANSNGHVRRSDGNAGGYRN